MLKRVITHIVFFFIYINKEKKERILLTFSTSRNTDVDKRETQVQ
jgi:hypothetical protein